MNWIRVNQAITPFAVKLFLPSREVRRTKLTVTTFEQFNNALLKFLTADQQLHNLVLRYRDDGDWVNFSSEEEFADAIEILRYQQTKNPTAALSIQVELGELKPELPQPVEEEEPVEEVVDKIQVENEHKAMEEVKEAIEEAQPIESESKPEIEASFIVVDQPQVVENVVDTSKEDEEELVRQSLHAMRQSVQSFIQNAPVQRIQESQYESDEQSDDEELQPQPIPVQPKEPEVPQKFAKELDLLAEMGFNDRVKNIDLLEQKNGDLSDVIQLLLGQ
jgi:hypothetical protein